MTKRKEIEIKDWVKERDKSTEERFKKNIDFKPLNDGQRFYVEAIKKSIITFGIGPSGVGKTYIACAIAAKMFLAGEIDRIVLSRPLVQCDEELGILPGSISEKVNPYLAPVLDCLSDFFNKYELEKLIFEEKIIICPLALMRGRTWKRSFIILDEANNATRNQLRMLLTRIGEGSKMVISGDVTQSDLMPGKEPPLLDIIRLLKGHKDIARIQLLAEDIVRHPLIQWIEDQLYEPLK